MPRIAAAVKTEQEGCRWLHNPPTGAEFGKWFKENVRVHAGLDADDYVNGITLIPNKETIKLTREDQAGNPEIGEIDRLVFSPYPQVDTRIRYFWDFCLENNYVGSIEILPVRDAAAGLPAGVFAMNAKAKNGDPHTFLGAKCRVRVYERDLRSGGKGRLVMEPPDATKTVPLHTRYGPDVSAAMKAETGAIGRALGFAGMLIVPGAGISTAEDMIEHLTGEPAVPGSAPEAATLPPARTTEPIAERPTQDQEKVLRDLIAELATDLKTFPEVWAGIEGWAGERGTNLDDPAPAALRPLERQLRRKLDQAKRAAATS